jgi:hypothetical protein
VPLSEENGETLNGLLNQLFIYSNGESESLHDLYTSPNINKAIKLRGMRWTGHVARKEKMHKTVRRKPSMEGNNPKNLGVDGRVIQR